jgi:hypothetical protein
VWQGSRLSLLPKHDPQTARRLWKAARQREEEEAHTPGGERIRPIGLNDSRHTAVSHMLDAGITIDKVSKFMGHASITVTIDRYGHLLPGGEAEAAEILNEYGSAASPASGPTKGVGSLHLGVSPTNESCDNLTEEQRGIDQFCLYRADRCIDSESARVCGTFVLGIPIR